MRFLLCLGIGLGLLAAAGQSVAQEQQPGVRAVQVPLPGSQPGFPGFRSGNLDYKEIVPPLIDALKDPDTEVRHSAAGALAHVGQPAISALVDILKDSGKDKELRANAAYVLGRMGITGQEAMPTLVKALKDDDRDVRRRAAYAIENIVKTSNESGGLMPGMGPPGGFPGGFGGRPAGAVQVPDPGVVPALGSAQFRVAPPGNPLDKKEEKKDEKKEDKK
jgi:hypothetical protein